MAPTSPFGRKKIKVKPLFLVQHPLVGVTYGDPILELRLMLFTMSSPRYIMKA